MCMVKFNRKVGGAEKKGLSFCDCNKRAYIHYM